ncbi:MAG: response regulator [Candidatus Brocadiales bacterium]
MKNNKTIMIVEDDQEFQDIFALMLEETGHNIVRAYDGNDALDKLEKQRPDLMILDILLEAMMGDALFLQLKRVPEYADIPIIIVSSFPARDYKNLKEIDPQLVFLEKPFTKETLLKVVKEKLG